MCQCESISAGPFALSVLPPFCLCGSHVSSQDGGSTMYIYFFLSCLALQKKSNNNKRARLSCASAVAVELCSPALTQQLTDDRRDVQGSAD